MSYSGFERGRPLSHVNIADLESVLGRKLPDDYRSFLLEYGDAFVGGLVDGAADLPVLSFFGVDGGTDLFAKLRMYPDFHNDGVLPIARCELGNIYVLDKENKVHYVNYYGGQTRVRDVANTFQEFVDRIVVDD
jgi:hypothetical protein